jgi:hypothetical protein
MNLMKTILLMVLVLVMAGFAVGWVLTYQALGDTESQLNEAEADVTGLQQELQDNRNSLTVIQGDLQTASQNLSEAQSQLEEQIDEAEKYLDMYQDTQDELASVNYNLLAAESKNKELEDEITEIREKLELYEDTMGITVYSGINPPYTSGNVVELRLIDNPSAENPTWQELLDFLKEDRTDKILYVPGEFECGNFALELHNNAEAAGIKAAFVAVHYQAGTPHAVNAFKTVDKGLVYIDVTGSPTQLSLAYLDKKVKMSKDAAYITTLLFPQAGWFIPQGDEIVASIEIYW